MSDKRKQIFDALQKFFGFSQFKGNQEDIISNVLDKKDTFVILPTGGGKSLCYQLPALMMEGTAIIISPLIALMKNQVDSIRGYSQEDNVAHFLNSSLNKAQIKQVKDDIQDGKTKMLYIAPETLIKEENLEFFKNTSISFVAIDEAHCISEWGHDFRPEYRRIRDMIDIIGEDIPLVALTATATPKVRTDIIKILDMDQVSEFVLSFNRENLYYSVKPKGKKDQALKNITQFVKSMGGKSGIIYVQGRKTTEDIAEALNVNGIKSAPYHAGLDPKTRSATQDAFLMEDIDVICATIAFGMGIDKPDVRFVIHYDMPKSIENYYQETGRAGRDGLEGVCVAYYSPADLSRLEKFLRDKPVAEREMGSLLMQEVTAYAETSTCRRQFLLHYFGEEFDAKECNAMCDNCKHPKEKVNIQSAMVLALKCVEELNNNYDIQMMVDFIIGKASQTILDYGFNNRPLFGVGKNETNVYWNTVYRHAILLNLLTKDIEKYGVLKINDNGRAYIKRPHPIEIPLNTDYSQEEGDDDGAQGGTAVLDDQLLKQLMNLRRDIAKKKNVPPYIVFQDASLMEMATQYPITMDDVAKISGVSLGKAQKFAQPFIDHIAKYVEDNDIDRPTDFVMKTVANKSKVKVQIIQCIDRKMPLEDIAATNQLKVSELMQELDMIVLSGTKINIDYYINEVVDEYVREEIYDYFKEAETDDAVTAFHELKENDITIEEIELIRLKFLSDLAN